MSFYFFTLSLLREYTLKKLIIKKIFFCRLAAAEAELEGIMSVLKEKQNKLAEVEAQIANLETQFDASVAEKAQLEETMALTTARLGRSGRLTSALADEKVRWEQQVTVSLPEMIFKMSAAIYRFSFIFVHVCYRRSQNN